MKRTLDQSDLLKLMQSSSCEVVAEISHWSSVFTLTLFVLTLTSDWRFFDSIYLLEVEAHFPIGDPRGGCDLSGKDSTPLPRVISPGQVSC